MDDNRASWFNIVVGLLCFAAFVLLFWMLKVSLSSGDQAVRLPVLVITGVMALFASLAIVAVTFSVSGLSDETQALGLPEGSVRAAIAFSLVVIFAIIAIYFYADMKTLQSNTPSVEFAKQVFAVVGTLMTSVVSFYFATRATSSATTKAPVSTPTLTSITPAQASKAAANSVPVKISGSNLQLAKTVTLEKGPNKVQATNVLSNDVLVSCDFAIPSGLEDGKYAVIVATTDGSTATLPSAFDVTP